MAGKGLRGQCRSSAFLLTLARPTLVGTQAPAGRPTAHAHRENQSQPCSLGCTLKPRPTEELALLVCINP